jgi:lipopolysaccharide transport system ATP-binding protein
MAVRLGFAVASSISPDVLLIDEVLAVGDVSFIFKCFNRIANILPHTAIIFVSHSMPLISRICSSVMVLNHGQTTYQGNDVGKGIEVYSVGASDNIGCLSVGGSEMGILSVALRTSNQEAFLENETIKVNNGDPVELRIEYQSNVPEDLSFSPFVKLIDQQVRDVLDVFPFEKEPLFKIPGYGRLTINLYIDKLHLNRGLHSIVAGAQEPRLKLNYCRISNCASLFSESGYHGWAATVMAGQWSSAEY